MQAPQKFTVETEMEEDGRWIGEVPEIPGALVYGSTQEEATAKVQALALRILAERLEYGEGAAQLVNVHFHAV